jgi:hypothetical protein
LAREIIKDVSGRVKISYWVCVYLGNK